MKTWFFSVVYYLEKLFLVISGYEDEEVQKLRLEFKNCGGSLHVKVVKSSG
jgi:hypothetical protein